MVKEMFGDPAWTSRKVSGVGVTEVWKYDQIGATNQYRMKVTFEDGVCSEFETHD